MIVLSGTNVKEMLSMEVCIDLMADVMVKVSSGQCVLPLRWGMTFPDGLMGMMPGYLKQPECVGIKIVNIMTRNSGTSTSSHLGAILLVDANNGIPLAMINGAEVTAKRTAAASALATQFLARENSSVLTIVGTGEQARSHLEAMLLVRDINEVRICGRKIEGAEQFISDNHLGESIKYVPHDDVTEALQGSDIVCTVTSAVSPFLSSEQMESGMHVNLVGASTPDYQEAFTEVVHCSRYFVDHLSSARTQASELIAAIDEVDDDATIVQAEIGDVVTGQIPGRLADADITVYRSLGVIAQDLSVAWYLYEKGIEIGVAETEF